MTVISVENVSKVYRLGMIGGGTLKEDVSRWWAKLQGKPDPLLKIGEEHHARKMGEQFWALDDVSFQVKEGEVLGIIGRNGAGKSTLLKILSQVTTPTSGQIKIKGRIASLLEVGTGFHPELTGRENVFLNGAILGMTKAEIRKKFDEIVAFSEIEEFIDTPVKRYSSGMYVRLAFAVAAHLEPEILICDEVLAVGDVSFQKKCLGKMKDVSKREGRTVLFVSHNMAAVANLCSEAILLIQGKKTEQGSPASIIQSYLQTGAVSSGEVIWKDPASAPGNNRVRLRAVRVRGNGSITAQVAIDQGCQIEVEYWNLTAALHLTVSVILCDKVGIEVFNCGNVPSANLNCDSWSGKPFPIGLFRSVCTIPQNLLNDGRYTFKVAIVSNLKTVEVLTDDIFGFNAYDGGEMSKEYTGIWPGVIRPKLAWQTERLEQTH
jgi:lipopolysaccharide transport system ATP-binding protein